MNASISSNTQAPIQTIRKNWNCVTELKKEPKLAKTTNQTQNTRYKARLGGFCADWDEQHFQWDLKQSKGLFTLDRISRSIFPKHVRRLTTKNTGRFCRQIAKCE